MQSGERAVWGKGTGSTNSLQVPMDKVETMDILQPMGNIHQLWKSIIPVSADIDVVTHKLGPIHSRVFLDKIIDGTVDHPF